MNRRIYKTTSRILLQVRIWKLFIGSVFIGIFVTNNSCNFGSTCYGQPKDTLKWDSLNTVDSLAKVKAKEDSAKVADSIRISDSTRKADSMKNNNQKKVPLHPCYQPPRKKQN
ncbi:MAG: hypothetical protein V2A54_15190 [Bacteroidota bacterium]